LTVIGAATEPPSMALLTSLNSVLWQNISNSTAVHVKMGHVRPAQPRTFLPRDAMLAPYMLSACVCVHHTPVSYHNS